ncbi:hypothetical protein XPU_4845, partial [Xanthomonas arboricola pv. pruni str. MAFF 311562]
MHAGSDWHGPLRCAVRLWRTFATGADAQG